MNAQFHFCLRVLRGLGLALAWLGASEMGWAQITFGNPVLSSPSASPVVPLPREEAWPAVDWGLPPMAPGMKQAGWLPDRQLLPPPPLDGAPAVSFPHFGAEKAVVQPRTGESTVLGPTIDLSKPPPEAAETAKETNDLKGEVGPSQLGNVSFNRTAQSFNLGKSDDIRKDDLSRQLGKVGGSPNVVASAPISGWAIAVLAMLVVLIAMAIGYYENDRDDRHRRKKVRRRRHHHSS